MLVNDHDHRHLRDEFEVAHPGGCAWEYVARDRGACRIRISKLAATPLPRVLADAATLGAASGDVTGAVWKLQMRERDLDSNIIALPRRSRRQFTAGPDGLRYLTVHQRRQALTLTTRAAGG